MKIESQILSGKALDEEQKIMYTTKSSVEKAILDLQSIQTALEEIALEERGKNGAEQGSQSSFGVSEVSEEMKEHDSRAIPAKVSDSNKGNMNDTVEKLLKAVQVIFRYEVVTNSALPENVSSLKLVLTESPLSESQNAFTSLLDVSRYL